MKRWKSSPINERFETALANFQNNVGLHSGCELLVEKKELQPTQVGTWDIFEEHS